MQFPQCTFCPWRMCTASVCGHHTRDIGTQVTFMHCLPACTCACLLQNFAEHTSAVRSIQALHGTKVGDKLLHVSLQTPRLRATAMAGM